MIMQGARQPAVGASVSALVAILNKFLWIFGKKVKEKPNTLTHYYSTTLK
jgi:hypothetical protein